MCYTGTIRSGSTALTDTAIILPIGAVTCSFQLPLVLHRLTACWTVWSGWSPLDPVRGVCRSVSSSGSAQPSPAQRQPAQRQRMAADSWLAGDTVCVQLVSIVHSDERRAAESGVGTSVQGQRSASPSQTERLCGSSSSAVLHRRDGPSSCATDRHTTNERAATTLAWHTHTH